MRKKAMMLNWKEWVKRYWLAEVSAIIVAVIFAKITFFVWQNRVLSAFLTTWVENGVFYGIIAYNDLKQRVQVRGFNFSYGTFGLLVILQRANSYKMLPKDKEK